MAATKPSPARRTGPATPALQKITVARYREALRYLGTAVDELRDAYIQQGAAFRLAYKDGTAREPTAAELAPIASALGIPLDEAAEQIRASGLRPGYEEPGDQEILFASLIGAAPEALDGFLGLFVVLSMPKDDFARARESDTLAVVVRDQVAAMDDMPMAEQREKAVQAWEAMAVEMGYQPGKGWAVIARSAVMALTQAMSQAQTLPLPSSTGSPAPTDGLAATASTTPDGERPST